MPSIEYWYQSQRLVLGSGRPVVLGRLVERAQQVLAPAHDQRADVVGLEEPLVRVDRDAVGALQSGNAVRVALAQARGAAVGGIDVQPHGLALGDVGQAHGVVDRAGVRGARDGRDRERGQSRRAVSSIASATGAGLQPEPLVAVDHHAACPRGTPGHPSARDDREVGLVAGVHAHALQVGCRAARPAVPRSLASQMSRATVSAMMLAMTPPLVSTPQPSGPEPDEVAEPAGDLFLDERADRAGVPHVDALVDPLRQHLAGDRARQRGRREVAERPGVLGVVGGRRDPFPELRQDLAPDGVGEVGAATGSDVGPKKASRASG